MTKDGLGWESIPTVANTVPTSTVMTSVAASVAVSTKSNVDKHLEERAKVADIDKLEQRIIDLITNVLEKIHKNSEIMDRKSTLLEEFAVVEKAHSQIGIEKYFKHFETAQKFLALRESWKDQMKNVKFFFIDGEY